MEKILLNFFIEWLAVVEGKSDNPTGMNVKSRGLCVAFDTYIYHHVLKNSVALINTLFDYVQDKNCEESTATYPFGGRSVYRHEMQTDSIHLNEERLAFVRNYIKEHSNA